MILGLSSHGVPVTGWTETSVEALKGEYMLNFGVQPDDSDIKASSFIKISWIRRGSACLAYLNRALCRATQFDCLDIDGPLALLHVWAWERMPFLAPVLTAPSFLLARRWVNWVVPNKEHRRWKLDHYRQMFENITNDSFLWTPYDEH
ncbi:hypothetical protein PIB30_081189 [Stylosanthes scabra]|uniref:Aminotransferase-like plant mobile domain-containing protein n=1 Tax=Stylosanthes scabra TaxID=79078 RepID=A0ABU6VQ49_9FABA|nr:hypothetical protein [Stylosanthes scabra]